MLSPKPPASADRIDKWLWAVRLFKARALATEACRAGLVLVNGQPAKPGREVRAGEILTVPQGIVTRTLRVLAVPRTRIGAGLVAGFCADLTPPEEFAKAKTQRVQQILARAKGSGRPTKRDRRQIDRFFG